MKLNDSVAALEPLVRKFRRDLHKIPELGYQEVKTAFNEEAKNQGLLG